MLCVRRPALARRRGGPHLRNPLVGLLHASQRRSGLLAPLAGSVSRVGLARTCRRGFGTRGFRGLAASSRRPPSGLPTSASRRLARGSADRPTSDDSSMSRPSLRWSPRSGRAVRPARWPAHRDPMRFSALVSAFNVVLRPLKSKNDATSWPFSLIPASR